jgi:hypothetical protein
VGYPAGQRRSQLSADPLGGGTNSVIDREARDTLIQLLAELASGGSTNDQFEQRLPVSPDPAIGAVAGAAWAFYDDLHEHRLQGLWALSAQGQQFFRLLQRFLASDLEYSWRHPLILDLFYVPFGILTLGFGPRLLERVRLGWRSHGNWPFHASQWPAA